VLRRLTPTQTAVDLALAGAFLVLALLVEWAVLGGTSGRLALLVTVLGFTGALAVRRASPPLSLAIAWIAAVLQMLWAVPPRFADVAVFAVLYATAAYGTRLVFWLGLASAVVGAGVITLYVLLGPLAVGGAQPSVREFGLVLGAALFSLLLSWTAGALARTVLQARANRLAQVRAQAAAVAEAERVRIARDMHDVVAHSLAVVIAQADGARYAAATDPAAATAALTTIGSTARSALADVRLLLTRLRHSQGDGPQPTLADTEELYQQVRAAGVDLRVDVTPAPPAEPPAGVQLAVYRILQEALTNALRHGDGGPVQVALAWRDDRVEVSVDNGVSGPAPATERPGHGLIGMRERAELAGGHLRADRGHGRYRVQARLPVQWPA
jgi:signal transduction histidine kinase